MAGKTKIAWANMTFNPWRGCAEVSPACDHCYAREMAKRNHRILGQWGEEGTRVVAAESQWQQPLKWNAVSKLAEEFWQAVKDERPDDVADGRYLYGGRSRVFCASLADVFEDWQSAMFDHKGNAFIKCDNCGKIATDEDPHYICQCSRFGQRMPWATMNDVRQRLFDLIDATPNLNWLLLTKRPENIGRMWPPFDWQTPSDAPFRSNCWLGTTIENQEMADSRINHLLNWSNLAANTFLSVEPMLGPIDLRKTGANDCKGCVDQCDCDEPPLRIDWVIVGAESGPHARETKLDWVRRLRDQCRSVGVPFFVKQLVVNGKLTKNIEAFPTDLQYQEIPK